MKKNRFNKKERREIAKYAEKMAMEYKKPEPPIPIIRITERFFKKNGN